MNFKNKRNRIVKKYQHVYVVIEWSPIYDAKILGVYDKKEHAELHKKKIHSRAFSDTFVQETLPNVSVLKFRVRDGDYLCIRR